MTPQDMLNEARDRLDNHMKKRATMKRMLLGQGHVICMPGNLYLCLKTDEPDENGVRRVISNSITSDPWLATRLTYDDAASVASSTVNGNGQFGEAIHINEALDRCIEIEEKSIEFLERAINEKQ